MDWAELVTLDLSQFDEPGGKQQLAEQLTYAAQHVGFFYVQNFNSKHIGEGLKARYVPDFHS